MLSNSVSYSLPEKVLDTKLAAILRNFSSSSKKFALLIFIKFHSTGVFLFDKIKNQVQVEDVL